MDNKKILYVRNGPYVVNTSMYNLQEIGFCIALCKMGYDCDIMYYAKKNSEELIYSHGENRVKILWRKGYKILRTGFYPSLLKNEFVNKYTLVITTEYSQIMSLLWTFFNPKVVLYNGPYYNLFKIPIVEKLYDLFFVKILNKRIYKTFTKSDLSKKYLEEKGFQDIKTIGVGLNNSVFEKIDSAPEEVISLIDFIKKKENLLYVGSLDERKNFSFLVKIFEEIIKVKPDTILVIIGEGNASYIKRNLDGISKAALNNIIHIPKVKNKYLKEIYKNSDIFLLPSKQEIFGMVLLEAMFFGTVCISSLNGGSSTLIDNRKDGYIIEDFDIENWKKCILKLLNDKKLRYQISNKSKLKISQQYNWDYIAKMFINELNDL